MIKLKNQIKKFIKQIKTKYSDNLVKVILYGSRARGDSDESSDYDLLLIFDKVTPEIKNYINDLEGEFLYEFSIIISCPYSPKWNVFRKLIVSVSFSFTQKQKCMVCGLFDIPIAELINTGSNVLLLP